VIPIPDASIPDSEIVTPLPTMTEELVVIPVVNTSPSGLNVTPDPTFADSVAVKVVTMPVVALNVAAVVIPAISTPVGDNVTVPTPDRLLILSTLISDAIWVHFPPCFSYL
jgi:hypothetical protein